VREVVIVRGGALGDFILGLPLLDSLRATFPGVRVTLVAPRSWLPLAWRPDGSVITVALDDPIIGAMYMGVSPRLVDGAVRSAGASPASGYPPPSALTDGDALATGKDGGGYPLAGEAPALREPRSSRSPDADPAALSFADPGRVIPAIEALTEKPDLVLLLFRTVDPLFEAAWRALEPGRLLWYSALPEPGQTVHAVDHLLGVVDVLGHSHRGGPAVGAYGHTPERAYGHTPLRRSAASSTNPHVGFGGNEAVAAADWLHARGIAGDRPIVALHPGSGGRWKCWPAERFGRLASMLGERQAAQVLVIGGPADMGLLQPFRTALGTARAIEADRLPLRHLAAILARCSLYIGNDSGVTHLAAAAGCPTLALFGPTDDRVWGPRGAKVTILRGVNAGVAPPVPPPATWWLERPSEADMSVDAVFEAASSKLAGEA